MSKPLNLKKVPAQFGTDGWRGVLGADFTLERLLHVASAAAQELAFRSSGGDRNPTIIIGYDRRFLAKEFAESLASAVRGCGLEPLLSETEVPTPATSWAVVHRKALGALVITASHNPPEWLGLKIKGPFGGSVEGDFTKAVELRIAAGGITTPIDGITKRFDCREEHLIGLKNKLDLVALKNGLKQMGLKVFVDPMHGSAAGCIRDLLNSPDNCLVEEIRFQRDPLFGGNPPEPLERYVPHLIEVVRQANNDGGIAIGLVFDGDGDRIAAVDENGKFCSTQLLMPLFIDHLARVRNLPGRILKTVSGSDLMRLIGEELGREVKELPVGFKYIASEMLAEEVLVGGEESGGVGFGMHLPERDALFAALLILEALVQSEQGLADRLDSIQSRFGAKTFFDRIDLELADMSTKNYLEERLAKSFPSSVIGISVKEVIRTDGVKLRLEANHWVMFRFSGTEPLLRLYCEAPTKDLLNRTLEWAQDFSRM